MALTNAEVQKKFKLLDLEIDRLKANRRNLEDRINYTSGLASTVNVNRAAVTQHGSLGGLAVDDHIQYTGHAQAETITGAWTFNTNVSAAAGVTFDGVDLSAISGDLHSAASITAGLGSNLLGLNVSTQEFSLDTQAANLGFFGPASGGDAEPTFRAMVYADIPVAFGLTASGTDLAVDQAMIPTWTEAHNFSNADDVDLSDVSGAVQIGDTSGQHIAVDGNEIMSKSDPTTAGALNLQVDGGTVSIGAIAGANLELNGYLNFQGAQSITTTSNNLTIAPAGDIILNPTGNDLLPTTNYDLNIGALSKKFLTLHAAELWVETLVAQDTMATIGGRILVGPTTELTSDLSKGATTIYVKHNNLANGDRVIMEANSKLEWMAIASAAGGSGPYSYTVTRNLDFSGANTWYAGDAVFNTGVVGDGFIDLYSVSGVTPGSTAGPTIVGNVRTSNAYNGYSEHWAIGNLNALYGYSGDTYGAGFGRYDSGYANIVVDATNGLRLRNYTTTILQIKNSDGLGYFVGDIHLDTDGGIYQGTGTFASPTTGLKLWNDSGIGRLAGYESGTLQAGFNSNGAITAGGGNVALDEDGIDILASTASDTNYLTWSDSSDNIHARYEAWYDSSYSTVRITANADQVKNIGRAYLTAKDSSFGVAQVTVRANTSSGTAVHFTADEVRCYLTDTFIVDGDTEIDGGLNVGTATGAGTGDIKVSGEMHIGSTSTSHKLNIYDTTSSGIIIDADDLAVQRFARGGTNKWGMLNNHAGTDYFGIYDYTRSGYALVFKANSDTYLQNGAFIIGATAKSSKMTTGLTINQDGSDNEILAAQSSDVAHGMTDWADTDTFYSISKAAATTGAARLWGFGESTLGLRLMGSSTTAPSGTTTSSDGIIDIRATIKSGTSVGDVGTNDNLMTIRNNATTRYIFREDGTAYADIAWTTFSDERLKENMQPINYGLAEVMQMKPLSYTRYSGDIKGDVVQLDRKTGRANVGFLAQDMQGIIPEAIIAPPSLDCGFYAEDRQALIPVLVRAIQEQQMQIQELRERLN